MTFTFPKDIAHIPTEDGEFTVFGVASGRGNDHVVIVNPRLADPTQPPLVRIHSECFTGDTLGSLRCDCNQQWRGSLARIGSEGGVLIYLRQEGRGIGLINKIKAYALQERGLDTVEANQELGLPVDDRSYELAAKALRDLGVDSVRLITNNPEKIHDLQQHGITVAERIPLDIAPTQFDERYLQTKKDKLGHLIESLHGDTP
jgi:3,4-dihydroxy 2-butanone 4-phosphate synthase/GTP cyclohydrolase II